MFPVCWLCTKQDVDLEHRDVGKLTGEAQHDEQLGKGVACDHDDDDESSGGAAAASSSFFASSWSKKTWNLALHCGVCTREAPEHPPQSFVAP